MPIPLSIADLASVAHGESIREGLDASVTLAQRAERWGFRRIWYAEHHAVPSSATSVVVGHVAAHTERITLGAGGVMLPNHSPLLVAEQFGTLATLFPGRIELGHRVKRSLTSKGRPLTDDEARAALDTTQGRQVRAATRCTASGTPDVVVRRLEEFATLADADELIVAFPLLDRPRWFRSAELLAEQLRPAPAGAR